jgi:subtilisin family serine protease
MREMGKIGISIFVLSLFLFIAYGFANSKRNDSPFSQYAPDEVIVKFRSNTRDYEKDQTRVRTNIKKLDKIRGTSVERLKISPNMTLEETVEKLKQDPNIEFVEPNFRVVLLGSIIPDDPYFNLQWHLNDNTGYASSIASVSFTVDVDIDAPEAWAVLSSAYSGTMDMAIGVIDSGTGSDGIFSNSIGYLPNHEDLLNSLLFDNTIEAIDSTDQAGDGNTLVDDINGWNWELDSNAPADTPLDIDAPFHGTLISGIINAAWFNSVGVAGIGKNLLQVLPLRYDNNAFDIAAAIYYTAGLADAGLPVRVVNLSLKIVDTNGDNIDSGTINDAIATTGTNSNLVFFTAAGNESSDNDGDPVYPADYSRTMPYVMAVTATDKTGDLASFSNYGLNSVQIAAPGWSIYSTYRGAAGYKWVFGTSFATPIVASAGGLLAAANQNLASASIMDRILNGGDFDERLIAKISSGKKANLLGALSPFYPYSGLAPMNTTQSISMYDDSVSNQFGTIVNPVSSDSAVAVMVTDSSGAWAVSPKSPGVTTFNVSFTSGPVSSINTGPWRVTGISPFWKELQVGQTVDFEPIGSFAGSITWTVEDTSVGTIDSNGLFSAVGTGETRVILKVNSSAVDNSGPIVVIAATSTGGGGGGGGWGCGTVSLPPGTSRWRGLIEFFLVALMLLFARKVYSLKSARTKEV